MFDHNMNATVTFNDCTKIASAMDALKPLLGFFDWPREYVESDGNFDGGDFVSINKNGEHIVSMVIYTGGDVGFQYKEVLIEFASNLTNIAKPGFLKLNNHDTDEVTKFWYGEQHAMAEAKKAQAWRDASSELRGAGVLPSMLNLFEACLKYGSEAAIVQASEKANRADDAHKFFTEIEDHFTSLADVGDEFGQDTVRDLFYLHSAILSGSFIEHFRNDSRLFEVIDQLASRDKWTASIQPRGD